MYAAVSTGTLQPEKIDDALRVYQEKVVPLTKQLGVKDLRLLVNHTTGKVVLIGYYETEAAARDAETSDPYRQAVLELAAFIAGSPKREVYAVAPYAQP